MCTVVVRRSEGRPVQILAIRDESTAREFDDPGPWWPDFPGVVGGRDRTAGGSWCATDVATGTTALVVNRPAKREAEPGAPSRGVLPLLGARHGADWPEHVDVHGMASFALLLVTPDRAVTWDFDGTELTVTEHPPGTHMLTSGGPEDRKADRFLAAFAAAGWTDGWRSIVASNPPRDDPGALLVRHEEDGKVWATVFAELIEARPGALHLEHSRTPWVDGAWQTLDA
ncbi:NRDE family protein [Blastococcus sp. URHD0036]|uniref:NRDE family protein n=1 Tax=Blastococcus sp. URHD0036 TaxID=1380356 RepID=UPI0004967B96|nr:NRDE family protein [Blastococcus sp. URHD0036]